MISGRLLYTVYSMTAVAPLRDNLSGELVVVLRDMIIDGRLPAGGRINEVHLSQQLGVSRTPLREALSRLVNEGALRDVPRRGFFVRPLTAEEVRDIYPIRSILDPAALRMAGLPSPERMARMRALNQRFEACQDPVEIVRLDDAIHLELVAGCPNPVLVELIEQFMRRTRRYELGLMRHRVGMPNAVAAHLRIFAALDAGDLEAACRELEAQLMRGQLPVLDWLATREGAEGGEA